MPNLATRVLKTTLSAIHYSGAARLLAPTTRGAGAILMLHHVSPDKPAAFAPNRILTITPEFLDAVVMEVRRAGYDAVSMDEAKARLDGSIASPRPFVAFTFDDGYRDNRDYALPVLKRHDVPMTIYATSDFAAHKGFLWWLVLERVIARRQRVAVAIQGSIEMLACATTAEKWTAFDRIYWHLRSLPEVEARAVVADLAHESGIDVTEPCRELAMTWQDIAEISREPLVTIGAHTVSHMALAKLSAAEAHAEMHRSIADVEHHTGKACRHFCYPYGDAGSAGEREFDLAQRLGIATAVTTAKGVVTASHRDRLTALPRLSLNGDYQEIRYVQALLSGVPFLMLRGLEKARQMAGGSGRDIQLTSRAASGTHPMPPTM